MSPQPRWQTDPRKCRHDDDVCPTCDFDGYYASTYPGRPWRKPDDPEPPRVEPAETRALCAVCLTAILPGDLATRDNRMHAECDPTVARCPHCDGVL